MKKLNPLLLLILISYNLYAQDSLSSYQQKRIQAQTLKNQRVEKLKEQTLQRAIRMGFSNIQEYYAWQEKRQKGNDQSLEGLQSPNFKPTKCGKSKSNTKQSKRDWANK